jgi:hypothetical protein
LRDADELGAEQQELRRDPGEDDHEVEGGVDDVLGGHHAHGGDDHQRGDDTERDVLRDHHVAAGSATTCERERGDHRGTFLTLACEPASYASKSGTVSIHWPEKRLVVAEIGDVRFGELVFGAPEQGIERADLDAYPAVHAQRVVDVEAVELVDLAGLAARAARWCLGLVRLDVDAPVGHSRAQSMHEVQFSSLSAMTPRARVVALLSRAGTAR